MIKKPTTSYNNEQRQVVLDQNTGNSLHQTLENLHSQLKARESEIHLLKRIISADESVAVDLGLDCDHLMMLNKQLVRRVAAMSIRRENTRVCDASCQTSASNSRNSSSQVFLDTKYKHSQTEVTGEGLSAQISTYKNVIHGLESDLSVLERELALTKAISLSIPSKPTQTDIESHRKLLAVEEDCRKLSSENNLLRQELISQESLDAEFKQRFDYMASQYESKTRDLESQTEALMTDKQRLESLVNQLNADRHKLSGRTMEADVALDALNTENEMLRGARIDAEKLFEQKLQAERNAFDEKLKSLFEAQSTTAETMLLEDSISVLEAQLTKATDENVVLQKRIDGFEAQRDLIVSLENENSDLTQRLLALEKTAEASKNFVSDLESKGEESRKKLESELKKLEIELETAKNAYSHQNTTDRAEDEESMRASLAALVKSNLELKQTLQSTSQRLEYQLKVNQDVKKLIVHSSVGPLTNGKESSSNLLVKYNDCLVEIGQLREIVERNNFIM